MRSGDRWRITAAGREAAQRAAIELSGPGSLVVRCEREGEWGE